MKEKSDGIETHYEAPWIMPLTYFFGNVSFYPLFWSLANNEKCIELQFKANFMKKNINEHIWCKFVPRVCGLNTYV